MLAGGHIVYTALVALGLAVGLLYGRRFRWAWLAMPVTFVVVVLEHMIVNELPMIALLEVAAPHARIDLLHIDIQGGEADLIVGCLPIISEKVVYVLVGTHSRQIEGRIMETLFQVGWKLEIERPAIFSLEAGLPQITVDGVQGWRNPNLSPG